MDCEWRRDDRNSVNEGSKDMRSYIKFFQGTFAEELAETVNQYILNASVALRVTSMAFATDSQDRVIGMFVGFEAIM